jgi:hypothetical protein
MQLNTAIHAVSEQPKGWADTMFWVQDANADLRKNPQITLSMTVNIGSSKESTTYITSRPVDHFDWHPIDSHSRDKIFRIL